MDTSAGAHPYQLTATFNLNQNAEELLKGSSSTYVGPPALAPQPRFQSAPGQIGNPAARPRCSATEFAIIFVGTANACPPDTAIGVATITFDEPNQLGLQTLPVPLFNLEPAFGEPARFGFKIAGIPVILDTAVRSGPGGDYGVTVSTSDITEISNFISSTVTLWGVPGDPSHDGARGWSCLVGGYPGVSAGFGPCKPEKQEKPAAFLTLPTDCNAPFVTSVEGESWTDPQLHPIAAKFPPFGYSLEEGGAPSPLTGCNQLPFRPTGSAEATTDSASSPSGSIST